MFTYDANGNMESKVEAGLTTTIQWNYDNKPKLFQRNNANYLEFAYDGNGQRVKKYNYSNGQTVFYLGELYEKRNGTGIMHVFAGNQRLASVFADGTGKIQFYHGNHLGSASVITDQYGSKKKQIEYYPYGTYRAVGNINGTYDFDPAFPDVFYTFTGQEDDDELGFYNYAARLYDPVIGKFISPDVIVPDPNNPQSLNRYSYVLNNPLRYIDPTGNQYEGGDYNPFMWVNADYNDYGFGASIFFAQSAFQSSIVNFGLQSLQSDYALSSSKFGSDTFISTYYGPRLSSLHAEPSGSGGKEKIEALNKIATGISFGLLATPLAPVGGFGLMGTTVVELGVEAYEVKYESRPLSDLTRDAAIAIFLYKLGKLFTEATTGFKPNYSFSANRFYSEGRRGAIPTQVGMDALRFEGAFEVMRGTAMFYLDNPSFYLDIPSP